MNLRLLLYQPFYLSVSSSAAATVCFFKQNTAYELTYGDWSSDVCSSDLRGSPRKQRDSRHRTIRRLPFTERLTLHNRYWHETWARRRTRARSSRPTGL